MVRLKSLPRQRSAACDRQANRGCKDSEWKFDSTSLRKESVFQMDRKERHQHVYGKEGGRNPGGKAADQQNSTDKFHHGENNGEDRRERYAEMGEHTSNALHVEDVDLLISVHYENNSYNHAKYSQTPGLRFQSIAHEVLLSLFDQAGQRHQPEVVQR
jgi:hypothetical protein